MTPKERLSVIELCRQMQLEKDLHKFSDLAEELNRLLTPIKIVPKTIQARGNTRRELAQMGISQSITCCICGRAVRIEDCKFEEHGQAVHERCYAGKISLEKILKAMPVKLSSITYQLISKKRDPAR